MQTILLKATVLGAPVKRTKKSVVAYQSPKIKSLSGDFAWQEDAITTLSHPLSLLDSPTGSGKQVIISVAAYEHCRMGRRALIVVPTLGLGAEYINTNVKRRSGKSVKYHILPSLDFRSTTDGYHSASARKGTKAGLREFLLGHGAAVAVSTHQTLVGVWRGMTPIERLVAFSNLWLGFDEAHHISGVLSNEEDINESERKVIEDCRTYLGDIAEFICTEGVKLNSGMSAISATHFRGDKVPLFYHRVEGSLAQNTYKRHFLDHWDFLGFKSFMQECVGYDDPIETLLTKVSKEYCSLVYLCPKNRSYRRNNPDFVSHLVQRLEGKGLRVLDLITQETQEDNIRLLQENNKRYKEEKAERSYDVILAVNMLREGSDYLPISRIYDFAPSNSVNRTVQAIGRMLRRDDRKEEVSYSAFFYNLQDHDTEEAVRTLICDRINTALAGMLGVFSLFDDTRMPVYTKETPNVFQLQRTLETTFGEFTDKARESFIFNLNSMDVDDAVFSTVRELRQHFEGKQGWQGSLEEAMNVLIPLANFLPMATRHVKFRYTQPSNSITLPSTFEENAILAEGIREAGFDITVIHRALSTILGAGAEADANKFNKLDTILNSMRRMTQKMQDRDRQASDYAFSPHSIHQTKEGKKAYNRRRAKFRGAGNGTAIAPNTGEPAIMDL